MDVGTPSNAVRLFHCMQSGNHRDVVASVVSSANISTMADKTVCPHTACALHAAVRLNTPGSIIVRTADAKKFTRFRSNARSPIVLHNPHALTKTCNAVLLVGMPGMGKTTLSFMMGGHDSDCTMIADRGKRNLPEVIASFDTADAFIEYEGQTVIRMLDAVESSDAGAAVIATGGSAVHSAPLCEYLTDNDNVLIVWLNRDKVTLTDWSARGVVTPVHTPVTPPQQLKQLQQFQLFQPSSRVMSYLQ